MTTTTTAAHRDHVCAHRLNIDLDLAALVAARNVAACAHVLDELTGDWDAAPAGSCCKPIYTSADDAHQPACEHLLRIWDARSYLELAKAGAPTDAPAYGCNCNGSGIFYSGGAVVNGVYTGTTGPCYRCAGKGWQSEADRKRNAYYDNHVRVIPGI